MPFPKVEKVNLALRSGEIVEVDAVAVTTLDEARGLQRVEWEVKEANDVPGKVLYRKRWEGSLRMLRRRPSTKPLNTWLEGVLS